MANTLVFQEIYSVKHAYNFEVYNLIVWKASRNGRTE